MQGNAMQYNMVQYDTTNNNDTNNSNILHEIFYFLFNFYLAIYNYTL
jgi:hypothetical protein